MIKNKG